MYFLYFLNKFIALTPRFHFINVLLAAFTPTGLLLHPWDLHLQLQRITQQIRITTYCRTMYSVQPKSWAYFLAVHTSKVQHILLVKLNSAKDAQEWLPAHLRFFTIRLVKSTLAVDRVYKSRSCSILLPCHIAYAPTAHDIRYLHPTTHINCIINGHWREEWPSFEKMELCRKKGKIM